MSQSTYGIEATTLPALSTALDAAVIRHQVIANNIANANTPGFRPQRVEFDLSLATQGDGAAQQLVARLEPQLGLGVDGAVRLDTEVAAMAQNGAHYQALLKALNRHLSVLASAVSDGKR